MASECRGLRFGPGEQTCLERLIEAGLAEDHGAACDVTTAALVPEDARGSAELVVRASGVLAGLPAAQAVFRRLEPQLQWQQLAADGEAVQAGQVIARLSGRLRPLLAAERLALNFLQRLSGVASATRAFVDALAGTGCLLFDTRKTTPGWRALEKYAVRAGGGHNHRESLAEAVLIKDNHRAIWQAVQPGRSLAEAVQVARQRVGPGTSVYVEVESLEQLRQVLPAAPELVLLDNMPLDTLRAAVRMRDELAPQVPLEASGGITLQDARAVAGTGVDRISVGAITHSAPALDIAMELRTVGQ